MALMQVLEVVIISIDKGDDSWAIEGEIIFEDDINSAFEVTYLSEDDELVDLIIEHNPGGYDKSTLKEKIIEAATEFDD